jgi:hypothetical protein
MCWQDVTLIAKKISLGVALVVVPLVILFGGLRVTQRALTTNAKPERPPLHAN